MSLSALNTFYDIGRFSCDFTSNAKLFMLAKSANDAVKK